MTRTRNLRKRYRVIIFAAIVAAVIVPVGFALSPDSVPSPEPFGRLSNVVAYTALVAPIVVPVVPVPGGEASSATSLTQLPVSDSVKLLFVGSVFLGLAAAVRRAV